MRQRIAVIFEEDIYTQRGMFNAIRNRIKYLKQITDFDIDVYVIGCYEPWYIRKLRNTEIKQKVKYIQLDGITYRNLWYNFTLTDYLLEAKLHLKPIFSTLFYRSISKLFQGYDLISSHSTRCGQLAMRVSRREKIPFCVTWHGSDIHTSPFISADMFNTVSELLQNADCNFFVSENLQQTGLGIAANINSTILYNGRNELFFRYPEEKRLSLRDKYHIQKETKVIAFIGNLIEVKNPHLLPLIFSEVQQKYSQKLTFWIIGSGKMKKNVEDECERCGIDCIFWGGQPSELMPEFMNCIDVLVLPSRNEGLPLVTVEAIACGANVVGSDVGGISEAVGVDNVFPHGEDFVERIAERIVYLLSNKVDQPLLEVFDWDLTAQKEFLIYKKLLESNKTL